MWFYLNCDLFLGMKLKDPLIFNLEDDFLEMKQ